MHTVYLTHGFDAWRQVARTFLYASVPPEDIQWLAKAKERHGTQGALFNDDSEDLKPAPPSKPLRVTTAFVEAARWVSCHRSDEKWDVLYNVLWRMTHESPKILEDSLDPYIMRFGRMAKEVRRDAHKIKAFVRFRQVSDDPEVFIAWHRPDHFVVDMVAPFFQKRFSSMLWSIFTPESSVHWDGREVSYGEGCNQEDLVRSDDLDPLWLTYYRSIFNPARLKVKMMKQEMPVRHWATLPESVLIPELIEEAQKRTATMIEASPIGARLHMETSGWQREVPEDADGLAESYAKLTSVAVRCKACPLACDGTQVVFGEGSLTPRIVFVGEQPGDMEDIAGRPFVGPAGDVLSGILAECGLRREDVYLTNTVKHFKHENTGKARLHKRPSDVDIAACEAWLVEELALLKPKVLVCLGLTAAKAVWGRLPNMQSDRGNVQPSRFAERTILTYHPAAILRMPDPEKAQTLRLQMIRDIKLALAESLKTEETIKLPRPQQSRSCQSPD